MNAGVILILETINIFQYRNTFLQYLYPAIYNKKGL